MDGFEKIENAICRSLAGPIGESLCWVDHEDRQSRIKRTAHHEAGHIVVARHFGTPFVFVEIADQGGCVHFAWPETDKSLADVLAGTPSDQDKITEYSAALRVCGRVVDMDTLRRRTREILVENWGQVAAIADELLKRKKLTAEQVEEILNAI